MIGARANANMTAANPLDKAATRFILSPLQFQTQQLIFHEYIVGVFLAVRQPTATRTMGIASDGKRSKNT